MRHNDSSVSENSPIHSVSADSEHYVHLYEAKNSLSAHLAKLVNNALQALREVDVRLGNRPHHTRHQPHRPPPRMGIRLATGLQPTRRTSASNGGPRLGAPSSRRFYRR